MEYKIKQRTGNWLPKNAQHVDSWIKDFKTRVCEKSLTLVKPIEEFDDMVKNDPVLNYTVETMFKEAALLRQQTPLGTPEVKDFDEFLVLLNCIMSTAPEYRIDCPNNKFVNDPCGLIGFPINALLDWPMATNFGYDFFANSLVNQQFKKILNYWSEYLVSPESRYVLDPDGEKRPPNILGWLSEEAKKEMVKVACQASSDPKCNELKFEDFFDCDPSDKKYYGFKSWDDFFTRNFKKEMRPIAEGDDIIANACESQPWIVPEKASKSAEFWLKEQPYSLENMMNFDPLHEKFVGGTVYQAFLSALSYHRWNSPVAGTIVKAFTVNGSYYLENRYQGFANHDADGKRDPDSAAPNDSQQFLTSIATRGIIFIEADNPKIGLMCFIAVGMAEVSSCEITVEEGEYVEKGKELGMFHFGGSTHCLVFRPGVELDFNIYDYDENGKKILKPYNIPVGSALAKVL